MILEVLNCSYGQYDSKKTRLIPYLCGQCFITSAGKRDLQLLSGGVWGLVVGFLLCFVFVF